MEEQIQTTPESSFSTLHSTQLRQPHVVDISHSLLSTFGFGNLFDTPKYITPTTMIPPSNQFIPTTTNKLTSPSLPSVPSVFSPTIGGLQKDFQIPNTTLQYSANITSPPSLLQVENQNVTQQQQKLVKPKAQFSVVQSDRSKISSWITVKSDVNKITNVSILSKTRREQYSEAFPERIYSSLKYCIQLSANKGIEFPKDKTFILARLRVVDSENYQTIEKALKSQVEVALTVTQMNKNSSNELSGKLLIQFGDLSYHKEKKEYCLEAHFYLPNDMQNPIHVERSAKFRVYARKPNKKPYGKRKAENNIEEPENKKKKDNSAIFKTFLEKLEGLVELKEKLCEQEKQQATDLVFSKFAQIDNSLNFLLGDNVDEFFKE